MKKISIRHVLLLTVVGLTLGAVFVVSSVYSTTATTMFNQLGMSDMLQDMATVSDRLSTYVGRVREATSRPRRTSTPRALRRACASIPGTRRTSPP